MPWSALPSQLATWQAWIGKDHDKVWYTRWVKYIKGWFAFGPRATQWWAKWRAIPITILAVGGKGPWRGENDSLEKRGNELNWVGLIDMSPWYLSRIQYWKRWHLAVQWPLQITFHVYWKEADVPKHPNRPVNMNLKKMLYVYGPTHRDSDKVYWIASFFLGGSWK